MIKPTWAATIWSTADEIFFELPSITKADAHANVVTFPNTPDGVRAIVAMLSARSAESRFSTRGDPTSVQVASGFEETKIRRPKPSLPFGPATRETAREVMRKLGLI